MKTKITQLLEIEYPVIQGGMAWVAEHNLAAAVSNAGGLGIIGAASAPADIVREEIRKCRMLTDKPFGVNVMLLNPNADEVAKGMENAINSYIDANGNGVWDTGDYDADRQAEAVYYYSKELECKEKWDVTESWNLTATPRFRQKPQAIVKQKPDQAKKLKNRNIERAKQLGIEYMKSKGINLEKK